MQRRKNIGMVAHDSRKKDLCAWAEKHVETLSRHRVLATGTTGGLLADAFPGLDVTRLASGPLGGDQQLGALIAEGGLDLLVFLIDPLSPHPHDVDIKALLRLVVLYNTPAAYNLASADFLIASPHFDGPYEPAKPDYGVYLRRLQEQD